MCGISGVIGSDLSQRHESWVRNAVLVQEHRGSDFQQVKFVDKSVVFGHNRLSIIDLDKRSHQPFFYEGVEIIFNGEIYNFQELKTDLVSRGFKFSTTSDTEVLCAAYKAYGPGFLKKINGMFALAIYDSLQKVALFARDRLGQKPFFYSIDQGKFFFSSELSPFTYFGTELEQSRIAEYLYWGYQPHSGTILKGVNKLPPGHFIVYDLDSGSIKLDKYWRLPEVQLNPGRGIEQLHDLIVDSVRLRMVSDVPLGVFLSGGIDSSLVAAVASRISGKTLNTFSIGFKEDEYDESKYAIEVANHLGTNHYNEICSIEESLDYLKNITDFVDEPFADSSILPTLLLSKVTSKKVTVALTGDAGDEFFLGYDRYRKLDRYAWIYKAPLFVRKAISRVMSSVGGYRFGVLSRFVSQPDLAGLYNIVMGDLSPNWIKDKSGQLYEFEGTQSIPFVLQMSRWDLNHYLPNDINVKVDRAAMRYSLETRSPLMDYRILEYLAGVSFNKHWNKNDQKPLLKELLFQYVDPKFFDRPKSGFGVPIKEWFRKELADFVTTHLSSPALSLVECIDRSKLDEMVQLHKKSKGNYSQQMFKVLVLSMWLNKYGK